MIQREKRRKNTFVFTKTMSKPVHILFAQLKKKKTSSFAPLSTAAVLLPPGLYTDRDLRRPFPAHHRDPQQPAETDTGMPTGTEKPEPMLQLLHVSRD